MYSNLQSPILVGRVLSCATASNERLAQTKRADEDDTNRNFLHIHCSFYINSRFAWHRLARPRFTNRFGPKTTIRIAGRLLPGRDRGGFSSSDADAVARYRVLW